MSYDAESGDTTEFFGTDPKHVGWMVSAVLSLGFGVFGLFWLQENGVLMTRAEIAWRDSQRAESVDLLDASTVIRLERTPCFGTCPIYSVTIDGTGHGVFRGEGYVCEQSPPPIQIAPEAIARLVQGMLAVDFYSQPRSSPFLIPDAPTVRLSLTHQGRTHDVEFTRFDDPMPRVLDRIAQRIDELSVPPGWMGVRETRYGPRVCVSPTGQRTPVRRDFGTPDIDTP